jgi:hypothetical protein
MSPKNEKFSPGFRVCRFLRPRRKESVLRSRGPAWLRFPMAQQFVVSTCQTTPLGVLGPVGGPPSPPRPNEPQQVMILYGHR